MMSSPGRKWFLFLMLVVFGSALSVMAIVDFDFIKELHTPHPYPNETNSTHPTPPVGKRNGVRSMEPEFKEPESMEPEFKEPEFIEPGFKEPESMEPVQKRSTSVSDNEIEGRSTQAIVDEVQSMIEDFIKRGFENANKILLEQKNAAATTRESNFIQFHSPVLADVSLQHASDCRGLGMLETSKLIAEHFKIPKDEADSTLRSITIPEGICKSIETNCFTSGRHLSRQATSTFIPSRTCNAQFPYRNVDGKCNNMKFPMRGSAGSPFVRMIPAAYADGVNAARVSRSGKPLPNPRKISNALFNSNPNPAENPDWTQLLKGWGQFLDHDITRTPEAVVLDNAGQPRSISCCDGGRFPNTQVPPDCMPIDVTGDQFYRSRGISCIRFVRSLASDCNSCGLSSRTQVNANTHYIDASQIYGSNFVDQQNLRSFRGGQLKISTNIVERGSCPASARPCALSYPHQIMNPDTNTLEFVAGDVRIAEQPGLTSLHSVFVRYHNMLARALNGLNPQWNDETLYQETRRIVVAVVQQVTYSEFLPIVLGKLNMEKFKLVPIRQGFLIYNASVDPSISVAFSTSAYRFGHTLVGENLLAANNRLLPLQRSFNDDRIIQTPGQNPSQILSGEWRLNSSEMDVHFSRAIKDFLFASPPTFSAGMDLMALNIMRGRDHGVPGYNAWRRFCGFPTFSTFGELISAGVMVPSAALAMSTLFDHVDDIDSYVGGLSEKEPTDEVASGFLGSIFTCIVGRQFHNLRFGDRFWFENGNQPGSFTGSQLFAIKKLTLSSIMCDTTITSIIQPFSMLTTAIPGNAVQPCRNLIPISLLNPANLAAWKV